MKVIKEHFGRHLPNIYANHFINAVQINHIILVYPSTNELQALNDNDYKKNVSIISFCGFWFYNLSFKIQVCVYIFINSNPNEI